MFNCLVLPSGWGKSSVFCFSESPSDVAKTLKYFLYSPKLVQSFTSAASAFFSALLVLGKFCCSPCLEPVSSSGEPSDKLSFIVDFLHEYEISSFQRLVLIL